MRRFELGVARLEMSHEKGREYDVGIWRVCTAWFRAFQESWTLRSNRVGRDGLVSSDRRIF